MNEVDIKTLDFCGEMRPAVDVALFLSPVVVFCPCFVEIRSPFGCEAVVGFCIRHDVLGWDSRVSDFAIVSVDIGLGDSDLVWLDFFGHFRRHLTKRGVNAMLLLS